MSDPYTAAVSAEAAAPVEAIEPKDQVVEAPAVIDTKPTTNMKKFKIKVDGNEEDMELDLNDEASLIRHLQMSKAASKRMNEASVTKKQAERFIQALQEDPMRVLNDPRIMGEEKFRAIAEKYLSDKLQEQMLTPEERKRISMEEKLRGYEDQEKSAKEKVEQAQIQKLEEHYAEQFQKTIVSALESSNLPKNPFVVSRMASLMQKNIQHGLELEPQHLAQLVREDYQKELASLIGGANPEQILSMFGDELSNKIRKHDLAKLKASQPGFQAQKASNQSVQAAPAPKAKMRAHEYEEFIRNKK